MVFQTAQEKERTFNEKIDLATHWVKNNCNLPEYGEDTLDRIKELKNQCNRAMSAIQKDMKRGKVHGCR